MSELEDLRNDNAELTRTLHETRETLKALKSGEIDAAILDGATTPILLHAAQTKLRASEQMMRAIFDSALDAMLLADDEGGYIDANPAACALAGLTKEQLLGRRISDLSPPEHRHGEQWQTFLAQGSLQGNFPLMRPDGERRDLEYSAVANILPGVHLSILRDVTDRRRSEETKSQLAAIVEWSLDAIVSKTLKGTITAWNRGAERLFGYTASEAIGRPILMLIPPERADEERFIQERVTRGEAICRCQRENARG